MEDAQEHSHQTLQDKQEILFVPRLVTAIGFDIKAA